MNLKSELEELISNLNLIERAVGGLQGVLDNNTNEELDLSDKSKIEHKLDSFSLMVKQNGLNILRVRLILSLSNREVGYYDYETDLNGVYCDEYFVIS